MGLTINPADTIIRGYHLEITFYADVHHPGPGNIYSVIPMLDQARNFMAYYAFSTTATSNGTEYMHTYNISESDMDLVEAQKGIAGSANTAVGKQMTYKIFLA